MNFHMFICIFHLLRAYVLTRALHRYRGGHGYFSQLLKLCLQLRWSIMSTDEKDMNQIHVSSSIIWSLRDHASYANFKARNLTRMALYLYLYLRSWWAQFNKSCNLIGFLERAEFSGRSPSCWSVFANELAVIVNPSSFLHLYKRLIN